MAGGRKRFDAEVNAARAQIHSAGLVQWCLDLIAGKPLPIRDTEGNITGWTDPADITQRQTMAGQLLNRTLPQLKAQDIDVTSTSDGTLTIQFGEGIVAPGSRTVDVTPAEIEDAEVEDGEDDTPRLGQDATPVVSADPTPEELEAMAYPPEPRRRRFRKVLGPDGVYRAKTGLCP